MNKAAVLTWAV